MARVASENYTTLLKRRPRMENDTPKTTRYLTLGEQRTMDRALRRSVKIMGEPKGSNADEWHLFLCERLDNRAAFPSGLEFTAVQIAEAIEAAERRGFNKGYREANSEWHAAGAGVRHD